MFADTSSISSGTLARQWSFGTGANDTSTSISPTKIYTSANTYSVKLLSISNNGCKDSITRNVIVNPKPNAGFTINNLSQCINGNNFLFNDTSTIIGGTLTRKWNFGAGVSDTLSSINPSKVYASANTFSVKLVETSNNGCKDSITRNVTVNPKPTIGFTINNLSQCINGNNFLFVDTSIISNGTIIRQWNFGTGITDTSSTINPNKVYTNANTYSIKLVSISNNGCRDSLIKTINVHPKPNVGFTINNASQCLNGNNFLFNDTTTINGGTLTRQWNLGIGTIDTSTFLSLAKTYLSVGSYSVKIVSTSSFGCKDSIVKTVTVNPKPVVGFTINNSTQCFNGNVFLFADTSTISNGTLNRSWDFGNGANSSSINPSIIYATANTYSVKIVSTSNNGCKDSLTKTITVNPKPIVGFTINSPVQCINTNSFLFTDTSSISSGTFNRNWDFGNGTISSNINPSITYSTANTYQVKVVSTSNNGCKDSLTKTITVNPKPTVGFTINNSMQCVNGNSFLVNDTSTISSGTLTRNWDFGNGTSFININPTISYTIDSTYIIKLISTSNYGCKDSVSKTVTVYPKPIVGFTQNSLTQCFTGNNIVLNDTTRISSGTQNRVWNFGDATTSSTVNPTKSYTNAGTYQIKLVETSNNNCKDSIIKTFNIIQPKSGFTINSTSQCLIGNSFSFDDTSSTSVTRLWNLGDLTINTNDTLSKTYSNAGTYFVKLKIIDANNCSDSTTKTITVKASPAKPIITALTKSLLQSTVANSYQWYLNNTSITSATTQTLAITQNGNYSVKIDSTNGCSNLSDPFAASTVGVKEIIANNEIKIYPNPASTELYIETTSLEKLTVQLFDMTGKEVLGDIYFTHSTNINTQTLSEGIYFVRITDANGAMVKTQKILILP